ncbi:MAG: o-succinylbenzoate synthase [Acidimicrobiales bacterium]
MRRAYRRRDCPTGFDEDIARLVVVSARMQPAPLVEQIHLRGIELRWLDLHLRVPHSTASGTATVRPVVLARLITDQSEGWGECAALAAPDYTEEYAAGAWALLCDFLVPALISAARAHGNRFQPEGVEAILSDVRGNPMAKACLEMAALDSMLRAQHRSLADFLGVERDHVEAGTVVGLLEPAQVTDAVERAIEAGYSRVKLKIAPGSDLGVLVTLRERYPDLGLQADANGSFDMRDPGHVRSLENLDHLGLLCLEQPLDPDDLLGHAELAKRIATPVCLDESISSLGRLDEALALGACDVVCIKPARLGGLLKAVTAHERCAARDVPVWCGGMLETALARSANAAIAGLRGFVMPGDIGGGERFNEADPFATTLNGETGGPRVPIHKGPGVGPAPDVRLLDRVTGRSHFVPC